MDCGTPVEKKKKGKPLFFIIILILLVIGGVFLYRSKFIYRSVKVDDYDGNVDLERKGKETDIFEGLKLIPDDEVTTGKKGSILLFIDSDKELLASEETCFTINAVGNEKKGKVTIDLKYGKALATIDDELSDDSEFRIKTPNATCSVRGTKYQVAYDRQRAMTRVDVYRGVVNVKAGTNSMDVKAGESVEVVNDVIKQVPPASQTGQSSQVASSSATTAPAASTPAQTAPGTTASNVTERWKGAFLSAIYTSDISNIEAAAVIYVDDDDIPEIAIKHKLSDSEPNINTEELFAFKTNCVLASPVGWNMHYKERSGVIGLTVSARYNQAMITLKDDGFNTIGYFATPKPQDDKVNYNMTEDELISYLGGPPEEAVVHDPPGMAVVDDHNDGGAPANPVEGKWRNDNAPYFLDLNSDYTCTLISMGKDYYGTFNYTFDGNYVNFSIDTIIGKKLKYDGKNLKAETLNSPYDVLERY